MALDAMILVLWMLSSKPTFSFSSFTFIRRLFSSSSLSGVVSSAYLRLLIFLPEILIPACASSSPIFHMMYSAYKLNKQGALLQGIFPTQGSKPGLPHCRQILYHLNHKGSPENIWIIINEIPITAACSNTWKANDHKMMWVLLPALIILHIQYAICDSSDILSKIAYIK